jgi:hypothetical protein
MVGGTAREVSLPLISAVFLPTQSVIFVVD